MFSKRLAQASCCCLLVFCSSLADAATYSFQSLGGLNGATSYNSNATAVSADGSVVVGRISGPGIPGQAFSWTQAGGMVGLGHLPGNPFGAGALGVSVDGTTVVGEDGSFPPSAFRWTTSGGMMNLGDLQGGSTSSAAQGISADGSIIVGLGSSSSGLEAFRWTADTGMVGLGAMPGGTFNSGAIANSADGSVIVGNSSSSAGTQAFRWTASGGMEGLGDLAGGGFNSTALAVSGASAVIVGNGTSAAGNEAFRWTAHDGMVGLGYLHAGSSSSYARGVSGDVLMIIGDSVGTAFLWTAATGMVDIKSLLLAHGVTGVAGWQLTVGAAISADGHTLAGTAFSPAGRSEAWVATIPEPASAVLAMYGAIAGAMWLWRRNANRGQVAE